VTDWLTLDATDDGACAHYLDRTAEELYRRITHDYHKFLRVEQVVAEAARLAPGLVPSEAELASERTLKLADKKGLERRQGLLISKIAAHPRAGTHLCHAMLLPRPESAEALAKFRRDGKLDLGRARIERRGAGTIVTLSQPDKLNCEDDTTLAAQETAIDVVLMDPDSRIGILRGDVVQHPKYAGRHLFSSGINLTALYWGQISFMFYLARDMGLVNKLYRGLARPDADPSEMCGGTHEKLWVAVVEGFAIGGGCQLLLVMDHVIAERDAYMTLPARKEGIIPGMANLRLPRLVGDRLARQAILNDRRLPCDSPEGRLLCDEIVERADIEAAIDRTVENLTTSGVVSAAGNRKALRIAQEPLDLFRQYLALYAREQADCHFSPALIANLERNWQAHQRKAG
jgi:(3,5-dihydroxyphenyl)acetyl-CoA 1,2-dioxygenase